MIKVLLSEQFDEICKTSKHPQFPLLAKGGLIQGPTHETLGVLVSVWMKTKDGHPGQISLHVADLLTDCLGNGFGNRAQSECHGLNYYDGPQMSYQAHPSQVEGVGRQKEFSYFRQYFKNFQYLPLLWRFSNVLCDKSMEIASK